MKITTLVAYPVHATLLICSVAYRMKIIKIELSLIDFRPTQFEATKVGDAESQFEKNSAHYWFVSSDEDLSKADLILLENVNLTRLEMSFIRHATYNRQAPRI